MSHRELTVPIEGMTCGGCARSIKRALEPLPGVEAVEVTLEPGQARLQIAPGTTDRERVVQAIYDAGFDVPET